MWEGWNVCGVNQSAHCDCAVVCFPVTKRVWECQPVCVSFVSICAACCAYMKFAGGLIR